MIWIEGRPRSLAEMRFAAGLIPCPGCRRREIGAIELTAAGDHRVLRAPCPRCRTPRELAFEIEAPVQAKVLPLHLGGSEPSRILRPVQLIEELDRLAPLVVWDAAASDDNAATVERAATCLIELVKFIPDDGDAIPDAALDAPGRADRRARPERYQRGWLVDERARYLALITQRARGSGNEVDRKPLPPRGELTRRALDAHRQWLRNGRTGDGRLDVAHVDLTGARLGAFDLTAVRFHEVILDRAELAFTSLARAELVDLSAVHANLEDASFAGARVVRCDLTGANLVRAKLDDAVIGAGTWDRVVLDCATMPDARFVGVSLRDADLGNAELDGATFADCDLRGSSFALRTPDLLGTTRQTRFERCDLRDTKWAERDLADAVFVDCQLAGASGRPRRIDRIAVLRPDLSPEGDGTGLGSAADVLAQLGLEPD
jgi:uncharacterized protein YjbI with pentapeptide repeats